MIASGEVVPANGAPQPGDAPPQVVGVGGGLVAELRGTLYNHHFSYGHACSSGPVLLTEFEVEPNEGVPVLDLVLVEDTAAVVGFDAFQLHHTSNGLINNSI